MTDALPRWDEHEVHEELHRLRVRDRARRLFDAETRPPAEPPTILTLRQRLAIPRPPIRYRIEGWQPEGSRTMFVSQFKAGKTTGVGNLKRSLLDGDLWLGVAKVNPVGHAGLIDFEMSEHQLDGWLRDQGIVNDDRLTVIPMRGRARSFNILDDAIRAEWAERLAGIEYLTLDCLRPILDALGLNEHNEAGLFLTAFDALLDEAKIGEATLVHHMGHHGERSRGDSRLRDWPEVEWRLVRQDDDPASPRYISAYGRDVEIPESLLAYDHVTRRLTLTGGSRKHAEARAALEVVLDHLDGADAPQSGNAIETALLAETEHNRGAIREGLRLGITDGTIMVEKGPRNARLHSLSSPVRRSSPPPRRRGTHHLASSPIGGEVNEEVEGVATSPNLEEATANLLDQIDAEVIDRCRCGSDVEHFTRSGFPYCEACGPPEDIAR